MLKNIQKRIITPIRSVKYFTIKSIFNFDEMVERAKEFLKAGYQFFNDPISLASKNKIIVFYKSAIDEGYNLIKIDGERDLIWRLFSDLNKKPGFPGK
jgi:hypothetical protein